MGTGISGISFKVISGQAPQFDFLSKYYFAIQSDDEPKASISGRASFSMNLYKIEQLKVEALARCRKRLEIHGRTDVILPSSPSSHFSLRAKHGL
jgi:hypothetical protein